MGHNGDNIIPKVKGEKRREESLKNFLVSKKAATTPRKIIKILITQTRDEREPIFLFRSTHNNLARSKTLIKQPLESLKKDHPIIQMVALIW